VHGSSDLPANPCTPPPVQKPTETEAHGPRFPRWSFASAVVVTLLAIAALGHSSRLSLRTIDEFETRELAIERVCGEIMLLDEVLTMSARMCAATGDPAWEERYLAHVSQLDRAIARARALAPDAEQDAGSLQTQEANAALVELELRAFELVRAGEQQAAFDLLAGEEYERYKEIYSAGQSRYLEAMHRRVWSKLAHEGARARRDDLLLLVSLPLLALQWAMVARSLRVHIRLRRKVEERLTEHAEALEQSNLEVRHADRAKSDFLARMSHEIRTPMNGVLGAAELLADSEVDAEQLELVGVVRSSGLHLLSIIDDILDISKIEAGRLEIVLQPCDPGGLLYDVARMLGPRAGEKGITLGVEVAGAVPGNVLLDGLRVRQILMNLAGNALKFTERGGVRLELEVLDTSTPERCLLCFRVRDTGVGIPPEQLERIFEGFVQADASIARRFGGTGLGLTISRELATLMGGTISVQSELGRGTEFRVTLPADTAPGAAPASSVSQPAGAGRLTGRILVVEDNAVNQLVIRRRLERLGLQVEVAPNGRECLRALDAGHFDFVFMDCHMPEMDGFQATRAIRAREAGGARLPIVALTASAFPGDVEACRLADMDDFVSKPFTDARLREVLGRWLVAPPAVERRELPLEAS
jgi:signal transduction histidine kinase/CheY-like chemotaxis protein